MACRSDDTVQCIICRGPVKFGESCEKCTLPKAREDAPAPCHRCRKLVEFGKVCPCEDPADLEAEPNDPNWAIRDRQIRVVASVIRDYLADPRGEVRIQFGRHDYKDKFWLGETCTLSPERMSWGKKGQPK